MVSLYQVFRADDCEASGNCGNFDNLINIIFVHFWLYFSGKVMVKLHYFKNQRFSKLKAQCEREERLFVDPEFPPEVKSLYFSRATPPESVDWKRPKVRNFLGNFACC